MCECILKMEEHGYAERIGGGYDEEKHEFFDGKEFVIPTAKGTKVKINYCPICGEKL